MLRFILHRPIGVIMTFIAIIVISIVFIRDIPIALLPDVPIPRLVVQISASELDARTLETSVVRTMRNQLMHVNELKDITSRTQNGSATINLELDFGTNTDLSSIEVNEKIDQIMHLLPRDLKRPRVIKTNISDIPVFYIDIYPISAAEVSEKEFSDFIKHSVKKRLEQIPEVAFVDIHGLMEPEVVVIPKLKVLQSLNIDERMLGESISNANLHLGNVIIKDGAYQYNVQLANSLVTIDDIERLILQIEGQAFRLDLLADVYQTAKPIRGKFYYNEYSGVSLAVRRKSNANNFRLNKKIDTTLADLKIKYPMLAFHISNNQSEILKMSIESLKTALSYGLGFAALIIFLFFKDWRLPLLISISIPIGVTITLFGFYLFDISINIISLAGLILGVGLMIDNAIIIIENIEQKWNDSSILNAAVEGAEEVIKPLISSALTTSSVFLPLILLSGLAGVLFYDQAISISLALLCSILVSYFLLPTLFILIFKSKGKRRFVRGYKRHVLFITWLVKHRNFLIPLFIVLGGAVIWLYIEIDKGAFPETTRMEYSIQIDWNEQVSIEENSRRYLIIKEKLKLWATKTTSYIGELQYFLIEDPQHFNEQEIIISLISSSFIKNIQNQLNDLFKQSFPSANYSIEPLSNVFDKVFNQDIAALKAHIQSNKSVKAPDFQKVKPLYDAIRSEYKEVFMPSMDRFVGITILQDQLVRYQVSHNALISKLKFLFRGNEITQLKGGDGFIPIQLSRSADIDNMYDVIAYTEIRNVHGALLPLSSFVKTNIYEDYKNITSIKSGECLSIPFERYSSNLVNRLREITKRYKDYTIQFTGSYFAQEEQREQMLIVGGVVVLLLFFILAAQFESLLQPIIVALTLPIGVLGALLALYATGETLNIIATIGIIIMCGIDVNDAILKIDIMNKNIKKGLSIEDSILKGSERRIRPILMTSMTTILALVPILFSSGLGAELQRPLAIAVIGGLIFGTLASIMLVPMLYRFFYTWQK